MSDNSCFYCTKGEKLDSLMTQVHKFTYSTLYILHDQSYAGRCVLALNDHKTEVFQLNADERSEFFNNLSLSAQAIWELFNPQKINYAVFGDLVPHFHAHLAPKFEGGKNWGKPFCENGGDSVFLEEEELTDRIKDIHEKIITLIQ